MEKKIKKIILIIPLLIISFLIINFYKAKGCNYPYTEHRAIMYFQYNGLNCPYIIVYCCWWDSQNNRLNVYFKEVWNWLSCKIHSNDWNIFRNAMMTKMYNDAITKCAPPLPPCDPLPPPTITVTIPSCFYYENALVVKFPGDDPVWMLKLKNCGLAGKCEERLIVCIDYSKNPAEIVTLLDECEVIEEPFCGFDEPDIPPQGKSWEEAWLTDCFAKPCCP